MVYVFCLIFFTGCATTNKSRTRSHTKVKTKIVKTEDQAAIDAIIKSLREQ